MSRSKRVGASAGVYHLRGWDTDYPRTQILTVAELVEGRKIDMPPLGQIWFLLQAYRRRFRAIVAAAPTWASDEILSASQAIDSHRPAVWRSEN